LIRKQQLLTASLRRPSTTDLAADLTTDLATTATTDPTPEPAGDADDPEALEALAALSLAAEAALVTQAAFDDRVGALDVSEEAPDVIYVLTGYPANVNEVEECVKEGVLDGVVTIVDAGGGVIDGGVDKKSRMLSESPRPQTAFSNHLTTEVVPPRLPTAPQGKDVAALAQQQLETKYYTPVAGLGVEVGKVLSSKGWIDLAVESISCVEPGQEGADGEAGDATVITPASFITAFNEFVGNVGVDMSMFKSYVEKMVRIPTIDLTATKKAMQVAREQAQWTEESLGEQADATAAEHTLTTHATHTRIPLLTPPSRFAHCPLFTPPPSAFAHTVCVSI